MAQAAAMKAGDVLERMFGDAGRVTKKGVIDLVTEADTAAESVILDLLREAFPSDAILSEEAGQGAGDRERLWLVDPLDGTTNFAHCFPVFGVSIAFQVEGEVVLGIVHNPVMGETYEAVAGKGAALNGRPIRVSVIESMEDAMLGVGFPYDIRERPERVLRHFREILLRAQAVRRPGSAALDLCYVAAGRFDGFWEEGLNPWDTAAGMVIAKEAGGVVTTYDGGTYTPWERTIVAANPHLHGRLLEILSVQ